MRTVKRNLMGIAAALFMLLFACPLFAGAEEITIQCGDQVYGTLDETGTLTIRGTGDMWNYVSAKDSCFQSVGWNIYNVVVENGVTTVGDHMFDSDWDDFNRIQNVKLGKNVRKIGDYAFYYARGLFSIDIPGTVQTIGEMAFYESSLKTCTLHAGLKTIGEGAFQNTWLTSIVIPEGISSIEEKAFYDSYLKSVSIPRDIAIIKSNAFGSVGATIYSKDVVIGANAFDSGSTFTAERGSTADTYASNYGLKINYFQHTYTVKFDANGGAADKTQKNVLTDTYYGSLPNAWRAGCKFEGWYTQPSGGSRVVASTPAPSGNRTLYAHWSAVRTGKCKKPTVKNTGSRKAVVKYKKVSGASGYQVAYSAKRSMKSSKTKVTTKTSKTITSLKRGRTYYFRVRAYKKDSCGKRVYGNWSSVAKLKIRR